MLSNMKKIVKNILWRLDNQHNKTTVGNPRFPLKRVAVKRGTYGQLNVYSYGANDESLQIGNFCSIADQVNFLLGGEHCYKTLSTYPFRAMQNNEVCAITRGPIVIEDDVWIGFGATLLSGVHVGRGAVIGARSLVIHDVKPYEIVGGIPARHIAARFSESEIQLLNTINYDNLDIKDDRVIQALSSLSAETNLSDAVDQINGCAIW